MIKLVPDRGLIFRIIHKKNLPWILANGAHCQSSPLVDPNYINIGNTELIGKRTTRAVLIPPGGTLSDYVPFYFTPRSPMLLNIKTGYNGVRQRANSDILILVSSLPHVAKLGLDFLFTDRHAYLQTATFYKDLENLDVIDWDILRSSDFKRDDNDIGKVERYQAEALIHRHVPVEAFLGVACWDENQAEQIAAVLDAEGLELKIVVKPKWYFS